MPKISVKPESAQNGLTLTGLDQSFRCNCKDKAFKDGVSGEVSLTTGVIEMVVVADELVYGPVPPINLQKLRSPDGPLKYQFAQKQCDPLKSTNQELFQQLANNALKNRGIIYGFFTPKTYEGFPDEAKKLINPNMVTSTNFHEVSLTRPTGGFAKYLLDLQNAGLASWEVITSIYMDVSHKNSSTGDDLFGMFFSYRLPDTKEEKAFVQQVKDLLSASGDIDIPRPRVLSQCMAYPSVQEFLVNRETMPKLLGTFLLDGLIASSNEFEDVNVPQLSFGQGAEFSLVSIEEIESQARRLLTGSVDMSTSEMPTIEVAPVV